MNINFFNDDLEENIVKIQYKDVKLFLIKNTKTIRHGMTMSVPDGFDRVSLYFYIN